MIRTTRARENRNRDYFDPRRGDPSGLYVQLLRPWMHEANSRGDAEWSVIQHPFDWYRQEIWIHNAMAVCADETNAHRHAEVLISSVPLGLRELPYMRGHHYHFRVSLADDSFGHRVAHNGRIPVTAGAVKAFVELALDDQGSFTPCSITP